MRLYLLEKKDAVLNEFGAHTLYDDLQEIAACEPKCECVGPCLNESCRPGVQCKQGISGVVSLCYKFVKTSVKHCPSSIGSFWRVIIYAIRGASRRHPCHALAFVFRF